MKPGLLATEFGALGALFWLIYDAGLLSDPSPWVRALTVVSLATAGSFYGHYRTRLKQQGKPT